MSPEPDNPAHAGAGQGPRLLQGNQACAVAAMAAGCRFYAGYPITPSSEIAEHMAQLLPAAGGVFIQMEDEIASLGAVLGASLGGVRAMTATSGPGFSLKQEHLGYASMAEIPCVVVNVMRGGPSTGMPTRPSQGDVMQARWGAHGDHPVIVLAPGSVAEIYSETVRAFELAERLRVPVVLLFDEVLAHLLETVPGPAQASPPPARRLPETPPESYRPYAADAQGVPTIAPPGEGYRFHTTGLTHGEDGFPTQQPEEVARLMARLLGKLERNGALIESAEALHCEDADTVVIGYGIVGRAARRAVSLARAGGLRVGLFRPRTLWPFPRQAFAEAVAGASRIVVAEMNAGQWVHEVAAHALDGQRVEAVNRVDGEVVSPREILARVDPPASRSQAS